MIDHDQVQWFGDLEVGDEVALRAFAEHLPRSANFGSWYPAVVVRRNPRGVWVRRVGSSSDLRVTPSSREWDVRPWSVHDDTREAAKVNDQAIRDWLRVAVFRRTSDGTYPPIPDGLRADLLAARGRMTGSGGVDREE